MRGAADEATRRTSTVALRAFDAPFLADIRRFATSPATRFQHPDAIGLGRACWPRSSSR